MAENQDQTPQRPPARHSAPPHQPQPGFGDRPQGYQPGSDPLAQSTPAPPPPPVPSPPSQGADPLAGTPQAPPVPSNWSEAGPPAASDRRDQGLSSQPPADYRPADSSNDGSDALFGQSPAPAPPPPPPPTRPTGGASTPYQGQQQAGPQHRAPQPPDQPYYAQAQQQPRSQPSQQQQAGQQHQPQQPPRAQHAAPPPQQPQTGQARPATGYSGPPQANQGQYGAQQQQYGAPQAGQQYTGQPQRTGQPKHPGQPQHSGQPTYAQQQPQPPYSQNQYSQAQHGQAQQPQHSQQSGHSKGKSTGNSSLETARRARLIGALVLVVAALATTGLSVGWIWTKADAVAPVTLPTGNQKPMKTVSPSVRPKEVPGKLVGTQIVAGNNDTMPIMGSAWSETGERTGLWSAAAIWLTVHKNYDGKKNHDWGNYVAFGQLPPEIPYTGKAGLREAAAKIGEYTVTQLYSKSAKVSNVAHKNITVDGHPGHEITARVAVTDAPGLETFSTVMFAVIDRGDGTAAVAIGDIAGSTPTWQNVWRSKVAGIKINS